MTKKTNLLCIALMMLFLCARAPTKACGCLIH